MNILCIGDIVGRPGREAVESLLAGIKKSHKIDFVIANAENAAGGKGINTRLAKLLLEAGCDVLTLGDHVWDQTDLRGFLPATDSVIRPANFPEGAPGQGCCVKRTASGKKIGVINLLGRVFMRYQVTCPFLKLKSLAEEIRKETPVIVVDMHAEATSEKIAMGWFIDGAVSAVVGTHTHVQTADEQILPQGTAYITDLGMTGPHDSVIGQEKEKIIQRFLTSLPAKFDVAQGDIKLHGVVLEIDEASGKARKIERLEAAFPPL